ncbi:hypothetical protein P3S68_026857 [Capsicum galapagoense]
MPLPGRYRASNHMYQLSRGQRVPMGAGFFEKARADSETWDLGLVMNEGKLFELSPPAAYVVVGLIKLAKPRFPLPFTYVVENIRRHSINDLTESTKLCFSCSRPVMYLSCLPSSFNRNIRRK